MTRPYPSPYAHKIVDFVRDNPGCTKADVARHVAHRCHFSKLYYLVNTAIRWGAIRALAGDRGGTYALFVADHLR